MERIFLLNLKSELKNFVIVDAQVRLVTTHHANGVLLEESTTLINAALFTGNSAKWTFPQSITTITFARIMNIFVNPNLGREGLYSKEELFELNSCN